MPTTKDTKSTKESENKTLNAIFHQDVVNLDGAGNRAIEKIIVLHLRALRVLRGRFLPICAAERPTQLACD